MELPCLLGHKYTSDACYNIISIMNILALKLAANINPWGKLIAKNMIINL